METKILEVKVEGVPKYIPLFKKDGVWASKSQQGLVWWDPEGIKQFCLMDDRHRAEEVLDSVKNAKQVLKLAEEVLDSVKNAKQVLKLIEAALKEA